MPKQFDDSPEDMWRVVDELALFFKERGITQVTDIANIFALSVEMIAKANPEERIGIASYMMARMQDVATNHKGAN